MVNMFPVWLRLPRSGAFFLQSLTHVRHFRMHPALDGTNSPQINEQSFACKQIWPIEVWFLPSTATFNLKELVSST